MESGWLDARVVVRVVEPAVQVALAQGCGAAVVMSEPGDRKGRAILALAVEDDAVADLAPAEDDGFGVHALTVARSSGGVPLACSEGSELIPDQRPVFPASLFDVCGAVGSRAELAVRPWRAVQQEAEGGRARLRAYGRPGCTSREVRP